MSIEPGFNHDPSSVCEMTLQKTVSSLSTSREGAVLVGDSRVRGGWWDVLLPWPRRIPVSISPPLGFAQIVSDWVASKVKYA